MDKHVVSLEYGKKLCENGWQRECEFKWRGKINPDRWEIEVCALPGVYYQAPLITEFLEELPRNIIISQYDKNDSVRFCVTHDEGFMKAKRYTYSNSLPDALAEMWIILKENSLI